MLKFERGESYAIRCCRNDCRKSKSFVGGTQEKVLEFVETMDVPKKTIWDKLAERLKNVPQEEFAELPADASANLDHYLYGAPKK